MLNFGHEHFVVFAPHLWSVSLLSEPSPTVRRWSQSGQDGRSTFGRWCDIREQIRRRAGRAFVAARSLACPSRSIRLLSSGLIGHVMWPVERPDVGSVAAVWSTLKRFRHSCTGRSDGSRLCRFKGRSLWASNEQIVQGLDSVKKNSSSDL